MEATESLAGFIGPALGGVLYSVDKQFPIVCVVGIYLAVFIAVCLFFRRTVVLHHVQKLKREEEIKSEMSGDYSPVNGQTLTAEGFVTENTHLKKL